MHSTHHTKSVRQSNCHPSSPNFRLSPIMWPSNSNNSNGNSNSGPNRAQDSNRCPKIDFTIIF